MDYSPLLAPVVVLVAWSLVMLVWMAVSRGSQFRKLGITASTIPDGARGSDLDGRADACAQWKAHNYNHLMEQPTIFYAIIFTLIVMRFDAPINVWLAWGYVALRVIHSLVQSTVNVVRYRLTLFVLSSLCLMSLTVHAALRIFHG